MTASVLLPNGLVRSLIAYQACYNLLSICSKLVTTNQEEAVRTQLVNSWCNLLARFVTTCVLQQSCQQVLNKFATTCNKFDGIQISDLLEGRSSKTDITRMLQG